MGLLQGALPHAAAEAAISDLPAGLICILCAYLCTVMFSLIIFDKYLMMPSCSIQADERRLSPRKKARRCYQPSFRYPSDMFGSLPSQSIVR